MTYLIAAWNELDAKRQRLGMYNVGDDGARFVSEMDVPLAAREDMVDQLVSQGYRIGASAGDFVWVVDDRGFVVFAEGKLVASGERPPAGVTAVHVYYDETDRGRRGVRFEIGSGEHQTVVEQRDDSPDFDPTYGESNLQEDTRWARYLGKQLALWCDIPLVDDTSRLRADADLAIMRAAHRLLETLEASPTADAVESAGPVGRARELALRVVHSGAKAALDLQVTSAKGTLRTTPALKRGTLAQIAAFLRRVTTPATVQFAMNDVINELQREGLA